MIERQTDQELTCVECGAKFSFTTGEQDFFQKKRLSFLPKRCADCRGLRRATHHQSNRHGFSARCSRCGTTFLAPFEPNPSLPVFCRDCFKAKN